MRKLCIFLILVLVLLSNNISAFAFDVNTAANSVVRVGGYDNTGSGTGSAFVIAQDGGSTYLVTNRHVVTGPIFNRETGEFLGIYDYRDNLFIFMDNLNDIRLEATPIILSEDISDGLDLVILKVQTGLSNRRVLPLAPSDTVTRGDSINVLGFPAVSDSFFEEKIPSTEEYVSIIPGNITNLNTERGGKKYYQHNALAAGGHSGGPVLNEDGAVIGVHTFTMTQAEGFRGAIHIDYIIEQCERLDIKYTPYAAAANAEPEAEASASPGDEPAATPAPTAAPPPEPASGSLSEYWWVLLILIGGAGAFFGFTRKRAPAARPSAIPATQPMRQTVSSASSHLICTKGNFAGTTFPINGSLSIGRDPKRCQIVFPGDTKGISSLHCEVMSQPSGVLLTDKGSTYGTFLPGGRKLGANESVSLKSGDSFYLADIKNEFKIL